MKYKKLVFVGVVAVIAVVVVSATAYFYLDESGFSFAIQNPGEPLYDYTQGVVLTPGEYLNPVYNSITGDYRPTYVGMSDEKYEWYFGELPAMEKDFFDIARLIFERKITDYTRLGKEYWLQPEFYPAWFGIVNRTYLNFDPARWTVEGYGCYPMIVEITTSVRGEAITVNTYLRTGFGVNTYQGIIIRPYLPAKAMSVLGNTIFEQPISAEKYLSCTIRNPDDALYMSFKDSLLYDNVGDKDWLVVLKPTHTILYDERGVYIGERGFPADWVRLVDLSIMIAEDAPQGDYVIAFDVDPPCFEINQEYYYSQDHEYYGHWYYPGGKFHQTHTPHFQVILHLI